MNILLTKKQPEWEMCYKVKKQTDKKHQQKHQQHQINKQTNPTKLTELSRRLVFSAITPFPVIKLMFLQDKMVCSYRAYST